MWRKNEASKCPRTRVNSARHTLGSLDMYNFMTIEGGAQEMTVYKYRNFECQITKGESGYFCSIFRIEDNWELDYWYNPSIKTLSKAIKECEVTIDDYHDYPNDYE